MRDRELLRAIIEHPRDLTTRLIYADWLEDQGELERATQIRMQCAYADAPEYDYRRIAYRNWIVEHRGAEPTPTLPAGLRWSPVAFEAGFPSRLVVLDVDAFVAHADAICAEAPVHALEIDARDPVFPVERLAGCRALERITELQLTLGRFGRDHILRLAECQYLGALESLELGFEGVTADGLRALVTSDLGRRLVRLSLPYNFFLVHGRGLEVLGEVELPRLRHLALAQNRIPPEIVRSILANPHLALHGLNLFDNPLGDEGWQAVAASTPALLELDLGKTHVGLAGLRALAASHHAASLRALHIPRNGLGPRAATVLARARWPALEFLDASWHKFGEKGLVALFEATGFPELRRADLFDHATILRTGASPFAARIHAWFESTARMRETT